MRPLHMEWGTQPRAVYTTNSSKTGASKATKRACLYLLKFSLAGETPEDKWVEWLIGQHGLLLAPSETIRIPKREVTKRSMSKI